MEVAGLVIGVAGLAGLFNCCSSAFQLIQRGRAFGQDYKILETKLSNQELRLRAWGRACGLIDGTSYDSRLDEPELHCQLTKTLECIRQLLSDAKTLQDRYGVAPSTSAPSIQAPPDESSSSTVATNPPGRLERRSSLNRLLMRRSKAQPDQPAKIATALWVIEDREKFSELIRHLKDFIDDLEALTRSTSVPHRQLVFIDYEIECISDTETLQDIEAAREGDSDAVSDAASVRLECISQGTASIRSSLVSTRAGSFVAGSFLSLESYYTARSQFSSVQSFHFSNVTGSRFSMASITNVGGFDVDSLPAGERLSRRLSMLEVPMEARSKLKQFYKCDVVGDTWARKTELLSLFMRGHLQDEYTPVIFDEQVSDIQVKHQTTSLILSDVASGHEHGTIAGPMLSLTDVVIICFLLGSPIDDGNVEKWREIVKEYCPHACCLLAGIMGPGNDTNADIYASYGQNLAAKFDIPSYVQCNLEKGPSSGGVDDLFETAAKAVILKHVESTRPISTYDRFRFPWRAAARSRLSNISEISEGSTN
ncbi:hypothetical protein K491DRAFT_755923 [Lophiostoma macrostomum CBS 122681]|uniref:Prion-inhibition and propagation HeLo domain-containing protein n=1 Tax=Lophiostoma macrostomum CBS 122681 TaxID=1314788 RepID=A0A6A6TI59_9PLEO|nr:hypothetical protein K491DRAFT_755923 [Lophiostoma macrostomum CBS 122681]